MSPDTAYQILVIVLATTLAIFLILAIVLSILGIKFMKKANRVADSAETVAGNVETFSTSLKNAAGPAAAMRIIFGAASGLRRK